MEQGALTWISRAQVALETSTYSGGFLGSLLKKPA